MLDLRCEGIGIHLYLEGEENQSTLLAGKSGMGKTTLASLYGRELIEENNSVQLIDLGLKWGEKDKRRLLDAGAVARMLTGERMIFSFPMQSDLLGCGRHVIYSIGLSSRKAVNHLKNIFSLLLEQKARFNLEDIVKKMKEEDAEDPWTEEICQRLENCAGMPDIWFQVDSKKALFDAETSRIWDLEGLEEFQMQMVAGLILYQLYCAQRERARQKGVKKKVYIILDECQNLNFGREHISGICLSEGRKYGLSVILVTQFLKGRFSNAVLGQFKQSGLRFYFRMTEEDAAIISHQLSADNQVQKKLYEKLISLPQGNCLLIGSHTVGKRKEVSEAMRFIEIVLLEKTKIENGGSRKSECIVEKFRLGEDTKDILNLTTERKDIPNKSMKRKKIIVKPMMRESKQGTYT